MSTVDPRVTRSRQLIRAAALEELAASGSRGASVEAIAARAGAAKSTIYRLWGDRSSLLIDALESINVQPPPTDNESAVERVATLTRHFAEAMTDPVISGWLTAMIDAADRDPALREAFRRYSLKRRQALLDAIESGVASGELRATTDADLLSSSLIGAVLYARTMTDEPLNADRVNDLIAATLNPLSADIPTARPR